jgi:FixJ family two-component response regulator
VISKIASQDRLKEGDKLSNARLVSIIDDDESVRQSLAGLLRSFGIASQSFSSAEDFLASPSATENDCLIVDVKMPGMSGLDMQDALISRGAQIPIIFFTGFPDVRIRDRAQMAGAIVVLEKPFDSKDIPQYLEFAFNRAPAN